MSKLYRFFQVFIVLFLFNDIEVGSTQTLSFFSREFSSVPQSTFARGCCSFGYNIGLVYLPGYRTENVVSLKEINKGHWYGGSLRNEWNGQIYSCRGGFIDTAHLRDAADYTAYIAKRIYKIWSSGGTFILPNEGTDGIELIIHPLYRRPSVAEAITLAQKIVYDYLYWHEITTWYGYTNISIYSQRHSAFSIEDAYSNLLGTYVAKQALLDTGDYEQAIRKALNDWLLKLNVVSKAQTKMAFDQVDGVTKWWDSENSVTPSDLLLRKRNTIYGPTVWPWLVAEEQVAGCSNIMRRSFDLVGPAEVAGRSVTDYFELNLNVDLEEVPLTQYASSGHALVKPEDYFPLLNVIRKEVVKEYGQFALDPIY